MLKYLLRSLINFTLATLITWWFIEASPLYTSMHQKLLSCGIAGTKWSIQIIVAIIFLKETKWYFIRNISITCLVGSLILLPFAILSTFFKIDNTSFFVNSLIVAVATMILLYALSVKNAGISIFWWVGWLICLAIAITLQLTLVFNVL